MKRFYSFFLAAFLLAAGNTYAQKNDTIYFGGQNGSPGFGYAPSTLNVNLGDTVVWVGPFSGHTLEAVLGSTMVVDHGASNNTPPQGTSFTYPVTSVGAFQYWCTLHGSQGSGMHGSFTAVAAGVDLPQETKMLMDPIYPNPAMDAAMVHFTLDNPAHVTLRIYNSLGTLVQTPTNEDMGAGFHMLMIDTKQLASGSYQYVLQAGDAVLARAMIVAK